MGDMYTELINPIYGTVDGLPVIAVGAFIYNAEPKYVVIGMDGEISLVQASSLRVDVRFDENEWKDISPGAQAFEDE